MPVTRKFKETVQARLRSDRKYRKELLREGIKSFLSGDLDTAKAILHDFSEAHLEKRAARGSRNRFLAALAQVPAVEPEAEDVLGGREPSRRDPQAARSRAKKPSGRQRARVVARQKRR